MVPHGPEPGGARRRTARASLLARPFALACACAAVICLALGVAVPSRAGGAQPNRASVDLADVNDVLLNPGKGWYLVDGDGTSATDRSYADEAHDAEAAGTTRWTSDHHPDYRDVISLGYGLYSWAELEPSHGEYRWDILDKAIDGFETLGKRYAFGVMCADSSSAGEFTTPEWVFGAGAPSHRVVDKDEDGADHPRTYPSWTDPIFLGYLNEFVAALGKRYDGDPRLAFVEVRSYGNRGEQHLGSIDPSDDSAYQEENALGPEQLRELYVRPYLSAFPTTQLVNPWGADEYRDVYEWAAGQGASVLGGVMAGSVGDEGKLVADRLPSVLDFGARYATLKAEGRWDSAARERHVENGRPTYLGLSFDLYRDNRAWCDRMANKAGYWFRLKHAEYDREVVRNAPTSIQMSFANDGVAPIFQKPVGYVALLDDAGLVAAKARVDWDALGWKPGQTKVETATVNFGDVGEGEYALAFGLFAREDDARPTYLLGTEGKTDDGWYAVGTLSVVGQATPPTQDGAETPATPGTAEAPSSAETPETPATAEAPQTPDSAEGPTTPSSPDAPANPGWEWRWEGVWRYRRADGSMATGWVWDGADWYLLLRDGSMATGWVFDKGDWFYLSERHGDPLGSMRAGWLAADSGWYWLNTNPVRQLYGSMVRNDWVCDRGSWYLAGPHGLILTGWQWFEGGWYYLDDTGALLTNAVTPDGCAVDPSGRWVA